jgi:hypothetical protein
MGQLKKALQEGNTEIAKDILERKPAIKISGSKIERKTHEKEKKHDKYVCLTDCVQDVQTLLNVSETLSFIQPLWSFLNWSLLLL